MEEQKKKSFKDTLNLPSTQFSIRAQAKTKEPELRARWDEQGVDATAQTLNSGKEKFVLIDGPPYANGHIHMGTAFNKVLKDMVFKSKRMQGKHVKFVPGWDCHGLPIEFRVAKDNPPPKNPTPEQKVAFKKLCRDFANNWIDTQRKEFKQLGVLADWENPYFTMSKKYEADIIRVFGKFAQAGFIEFKGKTVPWCSNCQTVLATVEIEYEDRKDPSIYVMFPLVTDNVIPDTSLGRCLAQYADKKIHMLAWTTTPWTIPLNRAIVMHPTADYVVLQGKTDNTAFVVAEQLAEAICEKVGIEKVVLATVTPNEFEGLKAEHPLVKGQLSPIILDESVLLEQGTACVHSAPGCGPEDYILGVRNGLEIYSPLAPDGTYTDNIKPTELAGVKVADGQGWVIKKLLENGRLFHKESIKHSYPHCWRCHNGLMFRATDQWFCDLHKNNLVSETVRSLQDIQFYPDWGVNRLGSTIANRTEWCISRQRQWGTPIVAFFCDACEKPILDAALIQKVAVGVEKEGIEYWDRVTPAELGVQCSCGKSDPAKIRKEEDILDVWFDAGISHFAVLAQDKDLGMPADMFLEGSDQHRGYFQSSVLTSMILNGTPPMKSIMTHGFVVDAKGHKMSKSLGNVIAPNEVIEQYSTDILRLWVASADFEKDIVISDQLLKNVAEVYRKIRNTCRFMLANLYDFDVKKDSIELSSLKALDQLALIQLKSLEHTVRTAYDEYSFTTAYQAIANYCTVSLSSFYLDIIKDRLYVEKADGHDRRSAQTVIYHILDVMTHLMAPMLSYLAEEVSDHYQKDKTQSIHLSSFVTAPQKIEKGSALWPMYYGIFNMSDVTKDVENLGVWNHLLELRSAVLKAIEGQREAGTIKHSLEARVSMHIDATDEKGKQIGQFLKGISASEDPTHFMQDWLIVSQVVMADSVDGLVKTPLPWLSVNVEQAKGNKCPRCWHYDTNEQVDDLCRRCAKLV